MAILITGNKVFKQYDENYYISNDGDIYSLYSHKLLKHSIDIDGYHRVDIHGKHKKIHRLVYYVWKGDIPKGYQINHKDDNKNNNHIDNLYLGTQKQNIHDKIKNDKLVGNSYVFIVYDKKKCEMKTFYPSYTFIDYCNHPCNNKSIKKFFNKNWFKKRYEIILFKKIKSLKDKESVTTMSDECSSVG